MNYLLVASFLLYAVVVKFSAEHKLGTFFPSVVVVLAPFLLSITIKAILLSSFDTNSMQLFTIHEGIVLGAQLITAYILFRLLDHYSDTIAAWMGIAAGGAAILYLAIPMIMK